MLRPAATLMPTEGRSRTRTGCCHRRKIRASKGKQGGERGVGRAGEIDGRRHHHLRSSTTSAASRADVHGFRSNTTTVSLNRVAATVQQGDGEEAESTCRPLSSFPARRTGTVGDSAQRRGEARAGPESEQGADAKADVEGDAGEADQQPRRAGVEQVPAQAAADSCHLVPLVWRGRGTPPRPFRSGGLGSGPERAPQAQHHRCGSHRQAGGGGIQVGASGRSPQPQGLKFPLSAWRQLIGARIVLQATFASCAATGLGAAVKSQGPGRKAPPNFAGLSQESVRPAGRAGTTRRTTDQARRRLAVDAKQGASQRHWGKERSGRSWASGLRKVGRRALSEGVRSISSRKQGAGHREGGENRLSSTPIARVTAKPFVPGRAETEQGAQLIKVVGGRRESN